MPPRKAQTDRGGLGQDTNSIGTQGAGRKLAPKRKLDDRVGDAPVASKRGRKPAVQTQPSRAFVNPFALTMTESSQLTHLVPPESIPPHPPQSFNAMLPQQQRYDAYMQPDSLNTQESAETSPPICEGANIPIDPAIAVQEDSSPQGHSSNAERICMPPPPVESTQRRVPTNIAGGNTNPFDLSIRPTTAVANPFTLLSREMSVVPQKNSESVSPTLTEFSLAPSTALTTPNSLRSSSVAPPTSADDKRIAFNLTRTEPIVGTRAAIPKWLTDTIKRLENELKSQRQKLEEAEDVIHEQAEELVEL